MDEWSEDDIAAALDELSAGRLDGAKREKTMNKRRSAVNKVEESTALAVREQLSATDSQALARNTRNTSTGRFLPGNPGGPGRPRRAVEREYLATLSDNVSLDDWAEIVQANVKRAKQGDPGARDWLASHLLGKEPLSLNQLAIREGLGVTPGIELDAELEAQLAPPDQMAQILKEMANEAPAVWERALRLAGGSK